MPSDTHTHPSLLQGGPAQRLHPTVGSEKLTTGSKGRVWKPFPLEVLVRVQAMPAKVGRGLLGRSPAPAQLQEARQPVKLQAALEGTVFLCSRWIQGLVAAPMADTQSTAPCSEPPTT